MRIKCSRGNPLSRLLQTQITMKVIQGLYNGVTTVELDTLAAETAATLTTNHPDYAILAARIAVSNLHKETKKVFSGESKRYCQMTYCVICVIRIAFK